MSEPDPEIPNPRYKWPWFVLALALAGIVLAIVWMTFEVRKVRQERHFEQPVPAARP